MNEVFPSTANKFGKSSPRGQDDCAGPRGRGSVLALAGANQIQKCAERPAEWMKTTISTFAETRIYIYIYIYRGREGEREREGEGERERALIYEARLIGARASRAAGANHQSARQS